MEEAPRTAGRFEIISELGRGGMAVVHLARQVDLDREVALKELPALHAADPAFSERFARESQIAGGLNHPNIVTVHDYFEHEGVPYIAMEHMPSGSLRPFVAGLSQAQAFGVLEGVLAALSYAGGRGIVHRDLKPENLMLTHDGSVKVTDFGIAKAVDRGAARSGTAAGTTVGTPAYMAPEQALGKPVDQRTDLYSVGVIAYEMLVGRIPFDETDTPMAMLLKHVNEAPPPPASVRPELDPRLAAWIEAMLAKGPDERPANAASAWEQLEEIVLDLLGSRWRRDARVPGGGAQPVMSPDLTPAPFSADEEVEGFRTYRAPRPAAPPHTPARRPAPASAPAAVGRPPAGSPPPEPPLRPAPAPPDEEPAGDDFQFPTAEERAAGSGSRRALWIALAVVVVAGGGVGGAIALSGGGDEAPDAAPTLSAAEYREQGNRICGLSQAGLDDLLAAVPGTPTAQTVRNAVELYLNSTVAERLNGLRALAPPAPLAADHDAVLANQERQREIFRGLVAQLDEGAAPGEAVPAALTASEPLGQEANAAFRRLGLTRCAS